MDAPSLADVRVRLDENAFGWPAASRRQMLNALDRLSKLTETSLADLPQDEETLAGIIDRQLHWRRHGFQTARAFRDFRGRVLRAAREAGDTGPVRFTPHDSWMPEWRAFLDDLEAAIDRGDENPWPRRAIAHLAGYANRCGVRPADVDSKLLDALFAEHAKRKKVAEQSGLQPVKYARKAVDSARAWNRLVANRQDRPWAKHLPALQLEWEGQQHIVNPPLEDYPITFQNDVAAYLKALGESSRPVDPDTADGVPTSLPPELESFEAWARAENAASDGYSVGEAASPSHNVTTHAVSAPTIRLHRQWIRQAAGAVVRKGVLAQEDVTALSSICNYLAVFSAVNDFRRRQLNKPDGPTRDHAASAYSLAETLCSIAERWCDAPSGYVARMRRDIRDEVRTVSCGNMSWQRRSELEQFDEPWALEAWFEHPIELFRRAERRRNAGKPLTLRDVGDVETALVCRILGIIPARRLNLAQIHHIGPQRNIQMRQHDGAKSWLVWTPYETKNDRYVRAEIDPYTERMLVTYIRHWRPRYLHLTRTPDTACLFPGIVQDEHGNGHRDPGTLGRAFSKHMREAGLEMTLHLARHLAAKLLVDDDPALVNIAAELLGDSEQTVRKFYLSDRTNQASQKLREITARRRPNVERVSVDPDTERERRL